MPRHEILKTGHGVVVMVADHAVNSPATDNNGPRVTFSVTVDISARGNFSSANQLVIDKDTSAANGPAPTTVTPAPKITIDVNGYSVGFLTLKPRPEEVRTSQETQKRYQLWRTIFSNS